MQTNTCFVLEISTNISRISFIIEKILFFNKFFYPPQFLLLCWIFSFIYESIILVTKKQT
jgi:hypothetical protein